MVGADWSSCVRRLLAKLPASRTAGGDIVVQHHAAALRLSPLEGAVRDLLVLGVKPGGTTGDSKTITSEDNHQTTLVDVRRGRATANLAS